MTKKVRIENADNSKYKLRVKVFERTEDPESVSDRLVETVVLANPTDLTELFVYGSRYIVVEECL